MCGFLRRLIDAEIVDDARHNGVLAAPEAEDMPGDLRRTPDEEVEAPDVRVFVVARRGSEEDGAPPLREAPEPIGVVFIRLGERLGLTNLYTS